MQDVEAHTVELLLQYLYGCLKSDLTLPELVALFQASDKYALIILNQQCTRLLKAFISFDSIFELADLAQLHNCPGLLQACLQYVDSLQELEGILGSDTCTQVRNDLRLRDLHHQSEEHKQKAFMDRQHSANCLSVGAQYANHRSTM